MNDLKQSDSLKRLSHTSSPPKLQNTNTDPNKNNFLNKKPGTLVCISSHSIGSSNLIDFQQSCPSPPPPPLPPPFLPQRLKDEINGEEKNKKKKKGRMKMSSSTTAFSSSVPPIPPRIPIKRSASLTYRPKPPPIENPEFSSSVQNNQLTSSTPHRSDNVPLIVDPLNPRPHLARSAPTLSTINAGSHVLLLSTNCRGNQKIITTLSSIDNRQQNFGTSQEEQQNNTNNIISLARWPICGPPRSIHPGLDSLVGRTSATPNQYIDSPKSTKTPKQTSFKNKNLVRSCSTSSTRHVAMQPILNDLSPPHLSLLPVLTPNSVNNNKSYNLIKKLKNLIAFNKTSTDHLNRGANCLNNYNKKSSLKTNRQSSLELNFEHQISFNQPLHSAPPSPPTNLIITRCKDTIICSSCGKCRCSDCKTRNLNRNGFSDNCRSAVNCLTCMCLVKTIFYNCLGNEKGEERCSEEPCACFSQPKCCSRWCIMSFLFPCLPCLVCYLPLNLILSLSSRTSEDLRCKCGFHSSNSSGLKTLLDSELSNA